VNVAARYQIDGCGTVEGQVLEVNAGSAVGQAFTFQLAPEAPSRLRVQGCCVAIGRPGSNPTQ
jgi:hypothetical protein